MYTDEDNSTDLGYWDIQVDLNSIEGGYHGYQYNCIVVGSGAEITCYRDEFEFVD